MCAARRSTRKPTHEAPAGRKPTLSPTRIAVYLECVVKYRYIYHDKIGRFYQRARAGYSFGSSLHQTLQHFHEEGATRSPDELVQELAQRWISAGYETVEQEQAHREAGTQIVQSYHTAHQERVAARTETLAVEKTLTCDMGRFKLMGRVDRIDRYPDGRLEILDYKSGRRDTSPDEVANDLAMCCYQLIVKRLYPESPVSATIYCLRTGNHASAALSEEQLEEFARELTTLGDLILDQDYESLVPVPLPICPNCDFLPRCQHYWREQERQDPLDGPLSEEGL